MSVSILSTSTLSSQECFLGSSSPPEPLVLTSISQKRPIDRNFSGLVFYRRSLKVLRKFQKGSIGEEEAFKWYHAPESPIDPPKKPRGKINSFSIKSKGRLQHLVQNADCDFVSQMTLTYDGDRCPISARIFKQDLNRYLTVLRYHFPDIKYMWVLEFQSNGNPHYHLFLNIKYSPGYARLLGYLWNKAVNGSEKHLRVHQYVPDHAYKRPLTRKDKHGSFCPWDMGDGSYLTYKYLSKEKQKSIPPQYDDVGRFWGATRKVVKPHKYVMPEIFYGLFEDTVNCITGEVITAQQHINRFFRDLRNYQEKRVNRARIKAHKMEVEKAEGRWKVRKVKKFRSPIRRCCDATISKGVQFYEKWFEAYQQPMQIPF